MKVLIFLPLIVLLAKGQAESGRSPTSRQTAGTQPSMKDIRVGQKDWSKTVGNFALKDHFLKPSHRERRLGVENSPRLKQHATYFKSIEEAENEDERRRLRSLAEHNRGATIVPYIPGTERVTGDTSWPIPFGDGPGVPLGVPYGTKEYFDGTGNPTVMWEILACPVLDPVAFLTNPIHCWLGDNAGGNLAEFFASAINDDVLEDILSNTVVPIAVEALYAFSGLKGIETLFRTVCKIIGLIDDILAVVNSVSDTLYDFTAGLYSQISGVITAAVASASFGLFRERLLSEGEGNPGLAGCSGAGTFCDLPPYSHLTMADCAVCKQLGTDAQEHEHCNECSICWQPLFLTSPDVDGLCLPAFVVAAIESTDVTVPFEMMELLFQTMQARYIKKRTEAQSQVVVESVTKVIQDELTCTHHEDTIDMDEDEEFEPHRKLRAGDKTKKMEPLDGISAKKILSDSTANEAAKLGLTDEHLDGLLHDLSGIGKSRELHEMDEGFQEKTREALKSMELLKELNQKVEEVLNDETDAASRLAGKLLKGAVDPKTKRLDQERVSELRKSMNEISENRDLMEEVLNPSQQQHERKAQDFDSLSAECTATIDNIVNEVKSFVTEVLQTIVSKLIGGVGSLNEAADHFSNAAGVPATDLKKSLLLMPLGFLESMDPFKEGGLVNMILSAIVEIFQTIIAIVLFGCTATDDECFNQLPSVAGNIVTLSEDKEGNISLSAGCNSEFEAELMWYGPILTVIMDLLDKAANSVLEFINIPINIISFFLGALQSTLGHMEGVCGFIGGYVESAMVEATYYNSKLLLQEVYCRPVDDLSKPGYGCNGKDDNCDPDGNRDECDEDQYPPDIDMYNVIQHCGYGKAVFRSESEAKECIEMHAHAKDDCLPVQLSVDIEDHGKVNGYTRTAVITAAAQGCGDRKGIDTTTKSIEVAIDVVEPVAMCGFNPANVQSLPNGGFTTSNFTHTVQDNCPNENMKVQLDILSSEVSFSSKDTMILHSSPQVGSEQDLQLFFQAAVCGEMMENDNGSTCSVDSGKDSRTFVVRITATDDAGNIGSTDCSMNVVYVNGSTVRARMLGKKKKSGSSSSESAEDPPLTDADLKEMVKMADLEVLDPVFEVDQIVYNMANF